MPPGPWPTPPGFVLERVIGFGGTAVVLGGTWRGRSVAVKCTFDEDAHRLAREAAVLAALGPPYSPQLFEASDRYLVLERLAQPSLGDLVLRGVGPDEVRRIARELYQTLAELADRGIVHGDLSADNAFFDGTSVALIDFGFSTGSGDVLRARTTDLGAGTLHYLAPEVLAGLPATAASDVFSAATIVYELARGVPPFVGTPTAVAHGIALLRTPGLEDFAPPLGEILRDAHRKAPGARPTARELARRAVPSSTPSVPRPASDTPDERALEVTAPEAVAVLAVSGISMPAIQREVGRAGGFVARQRGPRTIAIISGRDHDAPVAAARAAAQGLCREGARCGIHVMKLSVRRSPRRPPRIVDTACDDLGWWSPDATPLYLSPEAARAHGDVEVGWVGHPELLAALGLGARRVLATGEPGLFTVVGGRGSGKSRLARELAGRLAALGYHVVEGAGDSPLPRAIIVDDAHRADPQTLARIETVVLGSDAVLAVVITDPALFDLRAAWGAGVPRAARHDLPALDAAAARQLASSVLGTEFVASDVLERVVERAGGHARTLVEMAELVRSSSAIEIPATLSAELVASHVLGKLPGELAAFAVTLAIADGALREDELDVVEEDLRRAGEPRVEASAALERLEAHGLAIRIGACWELRPAAIAEAVVRGAPSAVRRRTHERILAALERRAAPIPALAHHALHAGDRDRAAGYFVTLAHEARAAYQMADTETWTSRALDVLPAGDPRRGEMLILRAQLRYRRHRLGDALVDLDAVAALGDPLLAARADLEAGVVLDWRQDFTASWERARRARGVALALEPEVRLAEARAAFRQHRLTDAITILQEIRRQLGGDAQVIADLLLGAALAWSGAVDEAEVTLAAVLERCEGTGDAFHAAGALINRASVWAARKRTDAQLADLHRCMQLARVVGNPMLERMLSWNLAEILFWGDRTIDARPLAERSAELAAFIGDTVPQDALLSARIAIADGDLARARDRVGWLDAHCDPRTLEPAVTCQLAAVRATLVRATRATWAEITTQAETALTPEESIEVWYLRALADPADVEALGEFRARAEPWPIWGQRRERLHDR